MTKLTQNIISGILLGATGVVLVLSSVFFLKERKEIKSSYEAFDNMFSYYSDSIEEMSFSLDNASIILGEDVTVPSKPEVYSRLTDSLIYSVIRVTATGKDYSNTGIKISGKVSTYEEFISLSYNTDRLEIEISFKDYIAVLKELNTIPYNIENITLNRNTNKGKIIVSLLPMGVSEIVK